MKTLALHAFYIICGNSYKTNQKWTNNSVFITKSLYHSSGVLHTQQIKENYERYDCQCVRRRWTAVIWVVSHLISTVIVTIIIIDTILIHLYKSQARLDVIIIQYLLDFKIFIMSNLLIDRLHYLW